MIEDKISRSTWIESLILKDKSMEKFSIVTTLFTILTCSFVDSERNKDNPLIKRVSGCFDKISNFSILFSFKSLAKKV